jgi:hypothetical protein
MSNPMNTKAAYTKPTLIEYGSLAQHTLKHGFLDPTSPVDDITIIGFLVTAIAEVISSVANVII